MMFGRAFPMRSDSTNISLIKEHSLRYILARAILPVRARPVSCDRAATRSEINAQAILVTIMDIAKMLAFSREPNRKPTTSTTDLWTPRLLRALMSMLWTLLPRKSTLRNCCKTRALRSWRWSLGLPALASKRSRPRWAGKNTVSGPAVDIGGAWRIQRMAIPDRSKRPARRRQRSRLI